MDLVYTHMNLALVENARNVLENAGIDTQVKNQFLTSGFGEISGIDSWPELWVKNNTDTQQAKTLLAEAGIGSAEANDNEPEWVCACGESNGAAFDSCWQCAAERPR
jgi:hypothetical protein